VSDELGDMFRLSAGKITQVAVYGLLDFETRSSERRFAPRIQSARQSGWWRRSRATQEPSKNSVCPLCNAQNRAFKRAPID